MYYKKATYIALMVFGIIFVIFMILPFSVPIKSGEGALVLYSSEKSLLRQFRSSNSGDFSQWMSIDSINDEYIEAILKTEDKRFYYHPGFDLLAIARSAYYNILKTKIVTGGSTITQQAVRIQYRQTLPGNKFLRKIAEIILAVKFELHYSKDEILEYYINKVPLRFNQSGFISASKRIFNKNINFLSREEITALCVLLRRGNTGKDFFVKRFKTLWKRLYGDEILEPESVVKQIYNNRKYSYYNEDSNTIHFEEWFKAKFPKVSGNFHTSISNHLSQKIHLIVNNELQFLEKYNVENAAVIVLRNIPGRKYPLQLAAMVGSKNFKNKREGQINGCVSLRSAGSTLKPLLYGFAFKEKFFQPQSLINDTPLVLSTHKKGETYRPKNYDLEYWGPITVREALGTSRNIPALRLVDQIGVSTFHELLEKSGFAHLKKDDSYYGHGLALGTGRANLLMLTRLYSIFINNGILYPLYLGQGPGDCLVIGEKKSILDSDSIWKITHILSDRDVRRRVSGYRNFLDFPFEVAAKTGTSKDYIDAWTIGYIPGYVVGVWTGNFSGVPMKRISGLWGSGRIFQQVVRLVNENNGHKEFKFPEHYRFEHYCRKSGKPAAEHCPVYVEIVDDEVKSDICNLSHDRGTYALKSNRVHIDSPINGETYIVDPSRPLGQQRILLRIVVPGYSSNENYFYRIGKGGKVPVKKSLEKLIVPQYGNHTISLYRDDEVADEIDFFVE